MLQNAAARGSEGRNCLGKTQPSQARANGDQWVVVFPAALAHLVLALPRHLALPRAPLGMANLGFECSDNVHVQTALKLGMVSPRR